VTPAVPISLPSRLLERRYDVVSAERQAASANAQIGVAKRLSTRLSIWPRKVAM